MSTLQARNEILIQAPVACIWNIITDIDQLKHVNPGIINASGTMNQLNGSRTCQINNRGKVGNMKERLIEMVPEKRTVWTIIEDDMGMSKMLKDTKFYFHLENINGNQTKVVNETYYTPANLLARIMNGLVLKKTIRKAQADILHNLKNLSETNNGSSL